MRNAEREITVYNYFPDSETGYDLCKRTLISGVSVFCQTKVNVTKEGLAAADVCTIRIPEDSPNEQYIPPNQFKQLPDKSGYFTLAKGDKIVLGPAAEESPSRGDLEALYSDTITITGVTDNRGKHAPHWKVIGV